MKGNVPCASQGMWGICVTSVYPTDSCGDSKDDWRQNRPRPGSAYFSERGVITVDNRTKWNDAARDFSSLKSKTDLKMSSVDGARKNAVRISSRSLRKCFLACFQRSCC